LTNNHTRGSGLLENILSKKRTRLAISKIPIDYYSGKILDIGCGSFPYFLSKIDFKEKYGLDKNTVNIKNGKIKLLKMDLCNIKKLPFNNNTFDVITALAVFEHVERHIAIAITTEIFRILKKNGLFIMTTPASWADNLLKIFAKLNIVSKKEINEHKDLYTKTDLFNILEKSNFNETEINTGTFEFFMNLYAVAKK
jgi:ubiquinone/menaquinone biosynthesis C-methylase UbiE